MSSGTLSEVEHKQPQTLKGLLLSSAVQGQIATALPKHMTPERMVRAALTAMLRTPALAQCDQTSFMQAMLTLSQLGLEPDGRMAHLIPFNNNKAQRVDCQLIVDYKGLVELVNRSGKVSTIHADVVCENDDFEYDMGEIKRHRVDLRKPRGKVYAAYARVVMKDGTCKCEVMGLDQIEAIRKRSRAGSSGPWVTDWDEMAKKTVFRRASKWLSLSPELRDAVNVDDDQIEHTLAVETIPDKPASRVEAARARAGIQSEPQGEIAQEALAERDNDHEPDQAQDAVSEDEINRLMEQFKTVEPDKSKRMAYYKSVGIDPNKRIWPAAGVEAAWDHISELNEANKS